MTAIFLLALYILGLMLVLIAASLIGVFLSALLMRPFFKREDVEWFYSSWNIVYVTPVTDRTSMGIVLKSSYARSGLRTQPVIRPTDQHMAKQ